MWRYLVRRLLQMIVVFIGVTLLIYAAVFALPGDPIKALAGDQPMSPSVVQSLRHRYHLDQPFPVQYGIYVVGLLHGDLGQDFNGQNVSDLMAQRWPVTIQLAMTAWVIEIVVGVLLGVLAALRRGRAADYVVLGLTTVLISVPSFVLAYVAQLVLGVRLHMFAVAGVQDGWPQDYLLPAAVLAAFGLASISRLTRTALLENLRSDYVRTATAQRLTRARVVMSHAFRNSLIPIVTYLAINLGYLLSGAVIIEGVFNLPGVGQLLFRSIQDQQGTVVVGVATTLVLIFLLGSLAVDLLYGVLDPRIRYE
jgi:ABC-type dipeptide/oligopeptide/nickel transport system permease component